MMDRKWLALVISGSLLTGAGGTYAGMKWYQDSPGYVKNQAEQSSQSKTATMPDMTKIAQAYDLIMKSYVKKVDEHQLVDGAIQGMVSTLKDPYSVYMDAQTAAQFNESLDSSFQGIGAEVTLKDGNIVIVSPYKNSPAEKAGLKPNDQILSIDGKSTKGQDLYEATKNIRGKKGTTVSLVIMREGAQEPITVSVKRDEIPMNTVNGTIKKSNGKSIGYIQITQFAQKTAADFEKELKSMEAQHIQGLIIDVRGNPGGLLTSVQDILDNFVTSNKPLFQIEERSGQREKVYSKLKTKKPYPVAVLVDKGSASASEILAGALKESEGYALIGETTFGKGTVQQAVPMGDGSTIKLTMFKWLTPDGNWIHHKGVTPTIEVSQPGYFGVSPLEVKKELLKDMNNEQVQTAQKMLNGLGYGTGREDGYFDNQTATAVKAFQTQSNIPITGIIDTQTANSLEEAVMNAVKNESNDLQLQVALKYITK
jgi:carboxyl-terminal processing protease